MSKATLAVVPYRTSDDASQLRDEIAVLHAANMELAIEAHQLRAENARLRGRGALLPFGCACPKCGSHSGPDPRYRPSVSLFWGRWIWPEHMRRRCFTCGATWRTQTREGSER